MHNGCIVVEDIVARNLQVKQQRLKILTEPEICNSVSGHQGIVASQHDVQYNAHAMTC